nr:unnamed protein product [Callosobruchus chinensis]
MQSREGQFDSSVNLP